MIKLPKQLSNKYYKMGHAMALTHPKLKVTLEDVSDFIINDLYNNNPEAITNGIKTGEIKHELYMWVSQWINDPVWEKEVKRKIIQDVKKLKLNKSNTEDVILGLIMEWMWGYYDPRNRSVQKVSQRI